MKAYENPIYLDEVHRMTALNLPWHKLEGRHIVLSGASGLIGSCLIDVLLQSSINCNITAFVRNLSKAKDRFSNYEKDSRLAIVRQDVNETVIFAEPADYVIHLASCTHPVAYSTKPVETILTNITGTTNMLEYARMSGNARFVFASSNEIYGINRGDTEQFSEDYCGYIDSNTLRAGYPESKRCGEALCQAYAKQYGMDVVIPRFTRCFGPTLLEDDSKAMSQFLHDAATGKDIVLKSDGSQFFSYIYVTDAVSALLTIMLEGASGEAYNISDVSCDTTLRNLAEAIAGLADTNVIFQLPDSVELAGFSKATKARLDSTKLKALGWKPKNDLNSALKKTLLCLKDE